MSNFRREKQCTNFSNFDRTLKDVIKLAENYKRDPRIKIIYAKSGDEKRVIVCFCKRDKKVRLSEYIQENKYFIIPFLKEFIDFERKICKEKIIKVERKEEEGMHIYYFEYKRKD